MTDFPLPDGMTVVEGQVERIVYQNNDNGYTVCEIDSAGELVTAVGTLPFVSEGELIKAAGNWTTHANFGRQFKIEYFEKTFPSAEPSIIKYLSSGIVRGIGKTTAKRIVEKFGADTFNVIEHHPEWLCEIKGVTRARAEEIAKQFKEQFGMRSVVEFCANFFSAATSINIYKTIGKDAVDIIKVNPFVLCDKIYGINFEHADKIARTLNFPADAPDRIAAGIKYVIRYNLYNNGHVFVPLEKIIPAAASLLGIGKNITAELLDRMAACGELTIKVIAGINAVYLSSGYNSETYCASKLLQIDKAGKFRQDGREREFEIRVSSIEQNEGISYTELQGEAIRQAYLNGVFILTGGPGTGKTTVIKALIGMFAQFGKAILLAAPTGRAAKRMSQTTGMEAKTIHRMLEMSYENELEPKFNRDAENPLEADVIIIDEMSMVDIFLFKSLLAAVKDGAKLILIGDSDQLPSVGPGDVLGDIIKSGRFASIRLDRIFRQAEESLIVVNAHKVNAGVIPELNCKDNDFFFIERSGGHNMALTVADLYKNRLPKTYGNDIIQQIQVITPSKKGACGTAALNVMLQEALNGYDFNKKEKKYMNSVFREGDKVMQTRNNYSLEWHTEDGTVGNGVYNGDVGVISSIDNINEIITVRFDDDRSADYDFTILNDLIHAFAITVHKSQGSEYPVVILPISNEIPRLHTRNLLYTAITRAQNMVIVVSTRGDVEFMVNNNRHAVRYTGLCEILKEITDESV